MSADSRHAAPRQPPGPALFSHRAHDYAFLLRRWRRAAGRAGLALEMFAEADGYPVFAARSRRPGTGAPPLYVSAGIHGDEPAGTEALAAWVERRAGELAGKNLLLLPCLNPWGLENNSRLDSAGRDLNRLFAGRSPEPIRSLKRRVRGARFAAALNLHEDYDALGIYLYELAAPGCSIGGKILAAAGDRIPPDPRKTIEGRRAKGGLILPRARPETFLRMPEALWLHGAFSDWTATFESPSEEALDRRAEAQLLALDTVWRAVRDRASPAFPPGPR